MEQTVLSRRDAIASQQLSALVGSKSFGGLSTSDTSWIFKSAVELADSLIKELDKSK